MNEFELIEHFFRRQNSQANDVLLGIGDDAAIIDLPANTRLVLCMDTLVSGVHFPEDTSPADIAWKALAVNLSDMAAMGAEPRWITLSLTVPRHDDSWFEAFASGLHQLAGEHGLCLVGGDLSRGPLSVTVQLQGLLPAGDESALLTRQGAEAGDHIYVTGMLGGAAYALRAMLEPAAWSAAAEQEKRALLRPVARLEIGRRLRGLATSCIDISDGLQADLQHILDVSQVGAELTLKELPLSSSLRQLEPEQALELALTGGDDYELCFTLPAATTQDKLDNLQAMCPISRIGTITDHSGELLLQLADGKPFQLQAESYRHF